ncbi:MAG TPA: high-affinity branched-chain amino acid ABC transporter permease LivM [Rubrivivax sp.]|jgi:branched-chain amino acid transport system permease protein|nr:high-affinity branched-chain amino acid ABC transporter permease LivM [Rhodoferax sp.]MCL4739116.1 high-affinity branched-chain amino acid ABC transporter permease LivM [Burkholderiaceae bacterium]MCP5288776.1 high-affinity branched-chain amino acid ABC transporter permease LivM [Burkholderiaceae bacterium]HMQ73798.1 high-affinity branched-chain amino acid ABC transporter permease LivM [Rubrivivax sp.]HMR69954.1 high-affinity branched-chain amino acid ABC transporter permease LivM [Rubriviva
MAAATGGGGAVGAALRDASIAGLIALGLSIFMIGLRTEATAGGLTIATRWPAVALVGVVVFGGRLLMNLFVWQSAQRATARAARPAKATRSVPWLGKAFGIAMLALAVALPVLLPQLMPDKNRYVLDLGILVLTYVMLGWGLNIVVGLAGLLDLGYVAFYAVGAYSYALLALNFDLSFWACLPLAGLLAATWGVVLGFPVLRLRGDYLAIVTLAFGEIIRVVLLNWFTVTGGPDGLSRIPRPSFFGLEFDRSDAGFAAFFGLEFSPMHRIVFLYYLILALAMLTFVVTNRLRRLPVGRAWEALREDEIACRSLGLNTTTTKLSAFSIGAMFGGFAGAFFATRQGFISPESFTFIESAVILAIVVLGGLGSQIGVVIAALVMIGGFEVFRNLEEYRMLVFGVSMVLIMIWKPRGLISRRVPTVFLKERKAIDASMVAQGEGH